jgi:hypothetical protein
MPIHENRLKSLIFLIFQIVLICGDGLSKKTKQHIYLIPEPLYVLVFCFFVESPSPQINPQIHDNPKNHENH